MRSHLFLVLGIFFLIPFATGRLGAPGEGDIELQIVIFPSWSDFVLSIIAGWVLFTVVNYYQGIRLQILREGPLHLIQWPNQNQSGLLPLPELVSPADQPEEIAPKEAAFLEEVHQVIGSNLDNELFNTSFLCRAMAMSRSQLYRKIKALTGQSTARHIRSVRLKKARMLLETTDQAIGEIALRVGYKDFSHFSRSFSKEFGNRTSELRK